LPDSSPPARGNEHRYGRNVIALSDVGEFLTRAAATQQMPIQIFKNVIAANQCPVDPAGPTLRQSGHDIAAAYIDVSPSILEAVRRHTGIRSAVLEPQMTIIT
jgi:hypothetical protein